MELQQIDLMACSFKWKGTKICYLSRGKLRILAKDVGVSPDGMKLQIYNRIMAHLEESGAKAEIGKVIR